MKPPNVRPTIAPGMELREGDRMSQEEFHRRYEAYPEDVKIELIGGVVHMASPLYEPHGTSHPQLAFVICLYTGHTLGTEIALDMTVVLGEKSEPRPDLMLRLLAECGGQSRYGSPVRKLIGPPELLAEVSDSSRDFDLGAKKKDYLDAGVQEYLVVDVQEGKLHWFHFPSKRKLKADSEGIWKSRVFPGLWIDEAALLAKDTLRLLAVLQQGVATPAHQDFVTLLADRRARHA